ncbi:hypothetical protein JN11_04355 [Mucilaginibacter frigoritolerans]|uniref:Esterase n=1 Tax=Mucilaginibacter frigoritolerans TaxID=652788 RepID=A0A562TR98_9SPHI|nr:hypothetical protein [Mucilaginibacter frigoritolerans]TWI95616.1 hypothetical protein JN11_04355 [Mucilaginibacter frigoritolerans]
MDSAKTYTLINIAFISALKENCIGAILSLVLLLNTINVTAQSVSSPAELMQQGEAYYHRKDFLTSALLYGKAVKLLPDTAIGSSRYMAAYNGACSWVLSGQPDSAFVLLNIIAKETNFASFYSQMIKDSDLNTLHPDARWQRLCIIMKYYSDQLAHERMQQEFNLNDTTKRINNCIFNNNKYWSERAAKLSIKSLYKTIANFNDFPDAPRKGCWTLYHIKVNDTLSVPYLIHIPAQYNPKKKSPLYIFLHGGVGRSEFSDPLDEIQLETPLLKRVLQQQAFVILPFADKNFNWLYHQQAFNAVLKEIKEAKGLYNINNNKIYIGGHSDGGRGSFWFALHQRTPFAAFFALNYFPTLLNGNTPLRNLKNIVPFLGISGIQDQGFNFKQITQFVEYGRSTGANWNNLGLEGAHTLPYDKPDSVYFLFDQIIKYNRNPIPSKLEWETENLNNSECYWLKVTELDTGKVSETWHKPLNPNITSIKSGKDEIRDLNKKKSGAVIAEIKGNHIYIKASRIRSLEILVPEPWSEKYRHLVIYVNNKPGHKVSINPTKSILLGDFLQRLDREFLIVDQIKISI